MVKWQRICLLFRIAAQACRKKGRDISLKPAQMLIQSLDLAADAAVVVHNPSNMFYLSAGYTGEGVVYISR